MSLNEDLQAAARKILDEGRADVVIGHGRGSMPLRSTPVFVRNADDAARLVFDATCGANVVRYLRGRSDRAAVVAKACDSRTLVESLKENQVDPERTIVVSVPCEGVVDFDAVMREVDAPEILEAGIDGADVTVKTRAGTRTLSLDACLASQCKSCSRRGPETLDGIQVERVGDESPPANVDVGARVAAFEQKSAEERWAWFADQASKCVLCYACRNACPMCYCQECFVEGTKPIWLGREHNLSNAQTYHLMRALHLAGRCVGCGDCTRTCPMGVDLSLMGEKLRQTVKELYGAEPGASSRDKQALASFEADDWQDFFM